MSTSTRCRRMFRRRAVSQARRGALQGIGSAHLILGTGVGVLDVRYVGDSRPGGVLANTRHPARARMWVRADGSLPDDRRLHHAALAYASDLTLLSASTVPHGVLIGLNVQAASIDHAMWFHRPFRADEWLLYDQVSPSRVASALAGRLFQNGVLISNVAQEGLIRLSAPPDRAERMHGRERRCARRAAR